MNNDLRSGFLYGLIQCIFQRRDLLLAGWMLYLKANNMRLKFGNYGLMLHVLLLKMRIFRLECRQAVDDFRLWRLERRFRKMFPGHELPLP